MDNGNTGQTRHPFYIGLNMTGAVSAGAYTAGVMDFLIEALDAWYAARAAQPADPEQWTVPSHEVQVAVMSGASAGGMCSAIATAALCQTFTHIHSVEEGLAGATNPLYKAWVNDIDISQLTGSRDLPNANSKVVSVLDSTALDDIAHSAITTTNALAQPRPWLADPLRVILTLTNLNGVPYAVDTDDGSGEQTQTLYHADQREFALTGTGAAIDGNALSLSTASPKNWDHLQETAKATGAFPVMLAPRYLDRQSGEFNKRQWRISTGDAQPGPGMCSCSKFGSMPPNWPDKDDDAVLFRTLNVDGGVTNNSPFDCAHQVLTGLLPSRPGGSNAREAKLADRAVINIAPFLSSPGFSIKTILPDDLLSVFGGLIDTLVNQSRLQGENIKLGADETVYSRFVIAPQDDRTPSNALASATLSAFGGFLWRGFRDHDYQLGRRNCQQFLRNSFVLPVDNEWMEQFMPASSAARENLLTKYGAPIDANTRGLQIIPLVGDCAIEIPLDRRSAAMDRDAIPPIAEAATTRLKLVIDHLMGKAGWLPNAMLNSIWLFVKGRIKTALVTKIAKALAADNLIDPPQ